jgi:hypothetical protein
MLRAAKRLFLMLALCLWGAGPVLAADAVANPTPSVEQLNRMLAGTWQNSADPRFTRQLNPDGSSVDRYEGDDSATSVGRWKLLDGKSLPPGLAASKLPVEGFYLTLSERGDSYLYALTALDPQSLEMIDIYRKQKQSFARLK